MTSILLHEINRPLIPLMSSQTCAVSSTTFELWQPGGALTDSPILPPNGANRTSLLGVHGHKSRLVRGHGRARGSFYESRGRRALVLVCLGRGLSPVGYPGQGRHSEGIPDAVPDTPSLVVAHLSRPARLGTKGR